MKTAIPAAVPASPEPLSDGELAQRVAGGDVRAFEALMRRHNRTLFRTSRAILRDDADAEVVPLHGEDMPTEDRPDYAAQRAQTRRLLEQKIDALPEAYRVVFILRALEEFSVEETAGALGIPEATVRTRFFRARRVLREALATEIDFALDEVFAFAGERCDRIVAGVLARLE